MGNTSDRPLKSYPKPESLSTRKFQNLCLLTGFSRSPIPAPPDALKSHSKVDPNISIANTFHGLPLSEDLTVLSTALVKSLSICRKLFTVLPGLTKKTFKIQVENGDQFMKQTFVLPLTRQPKTHESAAPSPTTYISFPRLVGRRK